MGGRRARRVLPLWRCIAARGGTRRRPHERLRLVPTLLALAGVLPHDLAPLIYGVDASAILERPAAIERYEVRNELLLNADPLTGRAAPCLGNLKPSARAALRVGPTRLDAGLLDRRRRRRTGRRPLGTPAR